MTRTPFPIPLVLAVAVALGASACGSDDSTDQTQRQVTTTGDSTVVAPSTTLAGTPSTTTSPPTASPAPLGSGSRLRIDGLGPVRVGMTLDEARQAAGIPMTREDGEHCRSLRPTDAGVPVAIVAEGGDKVTMVNVTTGPIRTLSGIGIGSTEAEVLAAYPNQVEVRPGAPAAHWVIYRPTRRSESVYALVFVIDEGKVSEMKAGLRANTEQDENCA